MKDFLPGVILALRMEETPRDERRDHREKEEPNMKERTTAVIRGARRRGNGRRARIQILEGK